MKRLVYEDERFKFPFIAYVPEEINGKLPLVLQLHGAGEYGRGKEELVYVERLGFAHLFEKEEFPCILVMPQCSSETFWPAQIPNLRIFMDQIEEEFEIDTDRVYLTGISMGGYGTWYMALAYPELFAAIAPVCGGGMMWRANVLTMPVWAFHGTEDEVTYPMESINMIHAIRKHSKEDVRLTLLDGVGHDAWVKAYGKELIEWLLSKKKA